MASIRKRGNQNVDVRTVSSRLGHDQTSTTMNIYAHSLREVLKYNSQQ